MATAADEWLAAHRSLRADLRVLRADLVAHRARIGAPGALDRVLLATEADALSARMSALRQRFREVRALHR